MSENQFHYTKEEMVNIITCHVPTFDIDEAGKIAEIIQTLTFDQLDDLNYAIDTIAAGKSKPTI